MPSASYASERTSVENGAILGGLAGFLAGGVVGGLASPETNLAASVLAIFLNEEENNEVIEEQIPYIVIGTLAGVAMGALIGKRRERMTIRNQEFLIDFQPEIASTSVSTHQIVFALNISICY
ncbi:hypothetical protein SLH46_09225 [Draconibacterium sp. IB214405]|uniref:hypothetical protein n=1 Tax=Draconibacterium sp. IB214405 TaxID=3097352 RepID=UPI002A0B85C5|nr:hypothetical protein [Draconibacterium sp. IB214405]MDX8339361.1 hypothetical protein [Draconibacterium sp. IB214405]